MKASKKILISLILAYLLVTTYGNYCIGDEKVHVGLSQKEINTIFKANHYAIPLTNGYFINFNTLIKGNTEVIVDQDEKYLELVLYYEIDDDFPTEQYKRIIQIAFAFGGPLSRPTIIMVYATEIINYTPLKEHILACGFNAGYNSDKPMDWAHISFDTEFDGSNNDKCKNQLSFFVDSVAQILTEFAIEETIEPIEEL